jgi:hypothetical protein
MLLKGMGAAISGYLIDIVATDLSSEILEKAKAGIYTQFEVQRGLAVQLLVKYFDQVGETWQLAPELRSMVQFRPINLLNDFSALGTFDVVFCRNVLIYFAIAARFRNVICPTTDTLCSAQPRPSLVSPVHSSHSPTSVDFTSRPTGRSSRRQVTMSSALPQ